MAIEFSCPHCHHLLRTADDKAGLSAKCPACSEVIWVPLAGQSATESPAAPSDHGGFDFGPAPPDDAQFTDSAEELPRRRSRAELLCPNCSAANDPTADSCRFCGTSLANARRTDERITSDGRTPDAGEALSTAWTVYTSRFGLLVGAALLLMPTSFMALFIGFLPSMLLVLVLQEADVIDPMMGETVGPLSALPLTLLMVAALFIGVIKLHLNIASGAAASIGDLFYGLGSEGRRLIPGMVLLMAGVLLSGVTVVGPLVLWPILHLHVDQRMSLGDTLLHFYTRTSQALGVAMLIGLIVGIIGFVQGILIYPCCIGLLFFPFVQPFLNTLRAVAYLRWSGQRTAID